MPRTWCVDSVSIYPDSLVTFKLYLVRERDRQLLINVFAGLKSKFFYILADFHVSKWLQRGTELFPHIGYLRDYS